MSDKTDRASGAMKETAGKVKGIPTSRPRVAASRSKATWRRAARNWRTPPRRC